MKFISHSRRFTVIIMRDVKVVENGLEREVVPLYEARFKGSENGGADLSSEELEFAERLWDKHAEGRTYETDEVTPTPLIARLSTYDTNSAENLAAYETIDRAMEGLRHPTLPRGDTWQDGWMKQLTEQTLTGRAETSHGAFAKFEELELVPPWPMYPQFPGDAEDLFGVLVEQGHHLPAVLAYERQQQVHPELIPLLEEELAKTGVPSQLPGDVVPA